eukprot:2467135-Amphidinium_carterae.1
MVAALYPWRTTGMDLELNTMNKKAPMQWIAQLIRVAVVAETSNLRARGFDSGEVGLAVADFRLEEANT